MTSNVRTRRRGLIAIMFAAAVGLAGCGLHFSDGIEAKDEVTKRYTLMAGGTLEIRNTNGRIQVRPGDGNAIEIVATRVARAQDEAAAKDALTRIDIRETIEPGRVVVDSTGTAGLGFREQRQVHYLIKMPRAANLTVKTTNADVDVAGITGAFSAEAINGRISASGLENGAKVETSNGEIVIDMARVGGAVSCDTTNGAITLSIPRDTKAELSARVTNGAIDHGNLTLAIKEQSRRRLDASIGGGGPEIKLETTNGAIEIRGK